jgi:hypothetical protein
MKLNEEVIQECLNADSDAPAVFQLTGSETVHMIMHPNKSADTDDDSDKGTDEENCISIDKCISLTGKLTKELE